MALPPTQFALFAQRARKSPTDLQIEIAYPKARSLTISMEDERMITLILIVILALLVALLGFSLLTRWALGVK